MTLKEIERNYGYLSNLLNISHTVFAHPDYIKFYTCVAPGLEGMTGFYQWLMEVAMEFSNWETRRRIEWDGEWMEVVEGLVARIYATGCALRGPEISKHLDEVYASMK